MPCPPQPAGPRRGTAPANVFFHSRQVCGDLANGRLGLCLQIAELFHRQLGRLVGSRNPRRRSFHQGEHRSAQVRADPVRLLPELRVDRGVQPALRNLGPRRRSFRAARERLNRPEDLCRRHTLTGLPRSSLAEPLDHRTEHCLRGSAQIPFDHVLDPLDPFLETVDPERGRLDCAGRTGRRTTSVLITLRLTDSLTRRVTSTSRIAARSLRRTAVTPTLREDFAQQFGCLAGHAARRAVGMGQADGPQRPFAA